MAGASSGQVSLAGEHSRDPGTGRNHEGEGVVGSSWVELTQESKLEEGWLIAGMIFGMAYYFEELREEQCQIMLENGGPHDEYLAHLLALVEVRAAWGF